MQIIMYLSIDVAFDPTYQIINVYILLLTFTLNHYCSQDQPLFCFSVNQSRTPLRCCCTFSSFLSFHSMELHKANLAAQSQAIAVAASSHPSLAAAAAAQQNPNLYPTPTPQTAAPGLVLSANQAILNAAAVIPAATSTPNLQNQPQPNPLVSVAAGSNPAALRTFFAANTAPAAATPNPATAVVVSRTPNYVSAASNNNGATPGAAAVANPAAAGSCNTTTAVVNSVGGVMSTTSTSNGLAASADGSSLGGVMASNPVAAPAAAQTGASLTPNPTPQTVPGMPMAYFLSNPYTTNTTTPQFATAAAAATDNNPAEAAGGSLLTGVNANDANSILTTYHVTPKLKTAAGSGSLFAVSSSGRGTDKFAPY